jgi:hypothetical protein
MITPVTSQVSKALDATHKLIAGYQNQNPRWSDKQHYRPVVDKLEELAISILAATSSRPLLHTEETTARFNMTPGTSLATAVNASVQYLRDEASGILAKGSLNQHLSDNVVFAMDRVKALHGSLIYAIRAEARSDLSTLAEISPSELIEAADMLAERAHQKKASALKDEAR